MKDSPPELSPEEEAQLEEDLGGFQHDPLGHVLYSYPWGEVGSELEHEKGPRDWQRDFLVRLGDRLRAAQADAERAMQELAKLFSEIELAPIQEAVGSGHGVGKSALVAWLVLWAISTFEDTRGVVTANTDTQLRTKTWPEISKWHRLSIFRHWFQLDATALWSLSPGHKKEWRIDIIPWDERNPEAFQGLHNKGKRVLIIFDEASGIHDKIWEATQGALTDAGTEIIWCVFGNLTRTTGRFLECFGRDRANWSLGNPLNLDSRTVEGTNKALFAQWIRDHEFDGGEDSDFVRVRVRGLPPKSSFLQLIPSWAITAAQKREPLWLQNDPLLAALDIARGGDDNCVLRMRRGLDAKSFPVLRIPGSAVADSMRLVSAVVAWLDRWKPDAFFVDETGVGGPILNRIRQLGYNAIGVVFGSAAPATGEERCADLGTYMWLRLRDAIVAGLALPDDPILVRDLESREYGHDKLDRLKLEKKEHMKSRGLASPDDGDALAMLFAYPVAPKSPDGNFGGAGPITVQAEYNPYLRRGRAGGAAGRLILPARAA